MSSVLTDAFGREHNYLRISLTDACNLRCVYCMPSEKMDVTPNSKLMQPDEIIEISKAFINLGVNKIRLTGGEPLLRKEFKQILRDLSALPVKLGISTNAVLVNEFMDDLKAAKIDSVNVSLDTLNAEEFQRITKRNDFTKIKENIFLLLNNGFNVKLNMVVMRGINEGAIMDFVELTHKYPLDVRFIEFMPFSGNDWIRDKVVTQEEMLLAIAEKYKYRKLKDDVNDTARKYQVEGHAGTIAFISTVSNPFCSTCNRIRLTADGKLKNCLFSQGETDILAAYRAGQHIESLIIDNVKSKKQALGGRFDFEKIENRKMIKIGG